MTSMPAKPLTAKRRLFISHYLGDAKQNASEAARLAGYSPRSARTEGMRLLQVPEIAQVIEAELARHALNAGQVLAELGKIAGAGWQEFVTIRRDPKTGETVEVRMDLTNKVRALEILAKAHGLLTDRVDISGSLTNQVELVGIAVEDI